MTTTAGSSTAQSGDGRTRRRSENRDRIVTAFLELIRSGIVSPSAQAVAERAKVSPRTVFRCFQDMESLNREVVIALRDEFLPRAKLDLSTPDRRERLIRLVRNRASMFEDMTPFRLAAEAYRHRSGVLAGDHAFLVAMERERLDSAVNPDGLLDSVTAESLSAVTCFDFWRRLRSDQNLPPEEAARVMLAAALASFDAGPDAGPVSGDARS
ncbi:TetR/AcrR family transcriptional regulator [Maricaulis sp.]|uniref:TetR/AcrR family transcriptional regulator n=1 Tax=Maricaulis sp. TaxID=1486257 RepID=UPI003A9350A1